MLGAGLSLGWWFGRAPATDEVVSFAIYPPEKTAFSSRNMTINVPQFALAPDGRMIVFAAGAEGERSLLWRRPIASVTAQALAGTEDAQDPFWSPDSRWIGFFAEGKLKKIPALGGAVQIVVSTVREARGGTWGPETIRSSSRLVPTPYSVAATGGEPAPATILEPGESNHRYPEFLPDGRHFLYSGRFDDGRSFLYVGSLDAKGKEVVVRTDSSAVYASPGYLLFTQEGTLFGQFFDASHLKASGNPFLVAEHAGRASAEKRAISASATGAIA